MFISQKEKDYYQSQIDALRGDLARVIKDHATLAAQLGGKPKPEKKRRSVKILNIYGSVEKLSPGQQVTLPKTSASAVYSAVCVLRKKGCDISYRRGSEGEFIIKREA